MIKEFYTVITTASLLCLPLAIRVPALLPLLCASATASATIYKKEHGQSQSNFEIEIEKKETLLLKEQEKIEAIKQKLESEKCQLVDKIEKEKKTTFAAIEAKEKASKDEIEVYRIERLAEVAKQTNELNQKIKEHEDEYQNKIKSVNELTTEEKIKYANQTNQLKLEKAKLELEKKEFNNSIKSQVDSINNQTELIKKKAMQDIANANEELNTRIAREEKELEKKKQAVNDELNAIVKAMENNNQCWEDKFTKLMAQHSQELEQTHKMYATYLQGKDVQIQTLKEPEYFPNTRTEFIFANEVIRFMSDNGVTVRGKEVLVFDEELCIELRPFKNSELSVTLEKIKKLLPGIQSLSPNWGATPQLQVRSHCFALILGSKYQQFTDKDEVKEEEKTYIIEPSLDNYMEFFNAQTHVGVVGRTGSGKTTLFENILGGLIKSLTGNGEKCQIVYTNPKPPKVGESKLERPDYRTFQTSIYGLLECALEVYYRIENNRDAEDKNPDNPDYQDFEPMLFVFDEYPEISAKWNKISESKLEKTLNSFVALMHEKGKQHLSATLALMVENEEFTHQKFAGELLKTISRLGRSEKIKILLGGQNLMPSVLDLNKIELGNFGWVCSGDFGIEYGLSNLTQSFERKKLLPQWEARKTAAHDDRSLSYYSLFIPQSGRPYFANNPKPGYFEVKMDNISEERERLNALLSKSGKEFDPRDLNPSMGEEEEKNLAKKALEAVTSKAKKKFTTDLPYGKSYKQKREYVDYLLEKFKEVL